MGRRGEEGRPSQYKGENEYEAGDVAWKCFLVSATHEKNWRQVAEDMMRWAC